MPKSYGTNKTEVSRPRKKNAKKKNRLYIFLSKIRIIDIQNNVPVPQQFETVHFGSVKVLVLSFASSVLEQFRFVCACDTLSATFGLIIKKKIGLITENKIGTQERDRACARKVKILFFFILPGNIFFLPISLLVATCSTMEKNSWTFREDSEEDEYLIASKWKISPLLVVQSIWENRPSSLHLIVVCPWPSCYF